MRTILSVLALLALASPAAADLADDYRDAAARLTGAALQGSEAYDDLAYLCDHFGHRLSGTPQLEAAIDWCAKRMREKGLENVRKEEVLVPVWVRNEESAWIVSPARHELSILGLGRSVGTPEGGITAEVVVVKDFDELAALPDDAIAGRIVVYNAVYEGYGATVPYRSRGPSEAARRGAVAALVRSIGPMSYDTPHTGALRYAEDAPQIPAAAITIENATQLERMQDRGDHIQVHLEMGAQTLEDAVSYNVIGEIVGSELPQEIVVVSGHIDSWDVGQGAQDDGGGCMISMEALALMKRTGLRPRRTVRVVLFTNEENGLRGGTAYRDQHLDALEHHVAAIESDSGTALADGFRVEIREDAYPGEDDGAAAWLEENRSTAVRRLQEISPLLTPLGSGRFFPAGSGADIGPIVKEGVLGLGMNHDSRPYFEIHHTRADTFDKVKRDEFEKNLAILAITAFVLADMPDRVFSWPR